MIQFGRSSLLLAVVLTVGCSCAVAAESICESRFGSGDNDFDGYAVCVRSALKVDDAAQASVLVLPSFEPEYAISIVRYPEDGHWSVRYAIAEDSIWGRRVERYRVGHRMARDGDECSARIRVSTSPIGAHLAGRFLAVWRGVVDVPSSSTNGLTGLDGTTFTFSTEGKRAYTWSPQCGLPWLAADMVQELKTLAEAKSGAARNVALRHASAQLESLEQTLSAASLAPAS